MKNKTFSIINIAGLAVGLACFLFITAYVVNELSYDRYNVNADRIYRINSDIRIGGVDLHMPTTSDMMGQLLKKDYPQVEQYTRIYTFSGDKFIKKGNSFLDEKNVAYVDSTFFDVFTLPVVEGNTHTALINPNSVVISASTATKYFGTTDAVGKILVTKERDSTVLYNVKAVIKDIPAESHFHFDFLFSIQNSGYTWGQLTSHNFYTYLLLKQGTDYKAFEKNFNTYIIKYAFPYAQRFMDIKSMADFNKAGNRLVYSLIPLTKIHLYSNRSFEISPAGNIQYVYIFSAVALFILLIACINFMNLTTARSAQRAKEVGIRKVLGTQRKYLIFQFLGESTFIVFLSLFLSVAIFYLALPLFNQVANKQILFSSLFSSYLLPVLIALPFIVGLLAGIYPAFVLSAFKPVEILKGKLRLGVQSGRLRNVLVVVQFATSILLIIATLVVYSQLHFIQNKDLGYNKSQVLIVDNNGALGDNAEAFKNEVLKTSGVIGGTLSAYLPVANSSRNDNTWSKDAVMNEQNGFDMQNWTVDYDYINTLGMQIIRGRNFSLDFPSDSSGIIINETTEKILGFDDPIGRRIYRGTGDSTGMEPYTIIGVVKNFNFETLHKNIGPLALRLGKSTDIVSFRINTSNVSGLLSMVKNEWASLAHGMSFNYRFLDESFDQMYRGEQRVGKIALIFSVLAIFIACLGLFGLATFIAEQRTKEIGIRKVLGASITGILQMFSTDFIKLVGISFIISAPLSWYVMNHWLQNFAYHMKMSWWIFLLAGIGALVIALITVSFQAIKAAVANPVKSLRTE